MDTAKIVSIFTKSPKGLVQGVAVIALVAAAFYVGGLKTKVDFYEKGQLLGATTSPSPAPVPTQPAITLDKIKDIFKQDVIKLGDASRKVLFVEISDPSCPYCSIAAGKNSELNKQSDQFKLVADGGTYIAPVPEMRKLIDSSKASFAYIYFPGHGNGEMGAKALYCAAEKGKFWEVHDLLMSKDGYTVLNEKVKNDKTKSGDLAEFLKPAFDAGAMKSCLDSGKYDAALQSDIKLATSLGVQGTPGFFVNATNFAGAYSYKDMEPVVTAALK